MLPNLIHFTLVLATGSTTFDLIFGGFLIADPGLKVDEVSFPTSSFFNSRLGGFSTAPLSIGFSIVFSTTFSFGFDSLTFGFSTVFGSSFGFCSGCFGLLSVFFSSFFSTTFVSFFSG